MSLGRTDMAVGTVSAQYKSKRSRLFLRWNSARIFVPSISLISYDTIEVVSVLPPLSKLNGNR